jgi:hypothetical protein
LDPTQDYYQPLQMEEAYEEAKRLNKASSLGVRLDKKVYGGVDTAHKHTAVEVDNYDDSEKLVRLSTDTQSPISLYEQPRHRLDVPQDNLRPAQPTSPSHFKFMLPSVSPHQDKVFTHPMKNDNTVRENDEYENHLNHAYVNDADDIVIKRDGANTNVSYVNHL